MYFVILTIILIFGFLGFSKSIITNDSINPINAFFLNSLSLIGNHLFIFAVSFLIVTLFLLRTLKFEKKHTPKNKATIIITQTIFVFITGIFMAFVLLCTVAILELNFFAYTINMTPKVLGINTDINDIVYSLKKDRLPPEIIAIDNSNHKRLQAIAKASTGKHNFYGKYILDFIPSFLVIPTRNIETTILIDKTLIISGINNSHLEKISPVIAYLYIKQYFADKDIKKYPKVSIMNIKEYKVFRKNDFSQKQVGINKQIEGTQKLIASTSAQIDNDNLIISSNNNLIKDYYKNKNQILTKCNAEGFYNKSGEFIHKNTKDFCYSLTEIIDSKIEDATNTVDSKTVELVKNQELLKTYNLYNSFFKAQSVLTDSLKINIPNELGLFVPEKNELKIMVYPQNPNALSDYLSSVIHEYYHYASSTKNKSFKLGFFEEGLTEYFTRNTLKNSLNVSTNQGYPVFAKIIAQFTNMIPETELADIYFNKDENGLEKAINRVYGDNFYKNNMLLFESIQYTMDFKQLLKQANTIIEKLDGTPISKEDLETTSSTL